MYQYSSGFAGPLLRAGAPSCRLCLETDHAAAQCARSMRLRGSARTSLLLWCDSHRVLRRRPSGVSVAAECHCVVGGTCNHVMGHHRALTSTRVAHAECGAGGCARGARLLR